MRELRVAKRRVGKAFPLRYSLLATPSFAKTKPLEPPPQHLVGMKQPDLTQRNAGVLQDGVVLAEQSEEQSPHLSPAKEFAIVQPGSGGERADGRVVHQLGVLVRSNVIDERDGKQLPLKQGSEGSGLGSRQHVRTVLENLRLITLGDSP